MGYDLSATSSEDAVRTHARAFARHEGFALVGAVDPDKQLRAEFTQHYAQPAFASVTDALMAVDPQVVVIATPTDSHPEILDQVLGIPSLAAVLCEKPLAATSAEAMRMRDRAAAQGVPLFVNYIRRSTPGAALIRAGLESGSITGPLRGTVTYSDGLRHNGTHMIDLLQYWLGEPSTVARLDFDARSTSAASPDAVLQYDDAEILFLGRESGSLELHSVQLIGPEDAVSFAAMARDLVELKGAFADSLAAGIPLGPAGTRILPIGLPQYQHHAVQALHMALQNSRVQLTTADEAVRNLQVIETILGGDA